MGKLELTKANLVEIKPGHQYIIALDESMVSRSEMVKLASRLPEGFKGTLVLSFGGDPTNGLKVIEKKDDNSTNKSA